MLDVGGALSDMSGSQIFISAENREYFLLPNRSRGSSSIKSKNGDASQITYIWMTLVWLCDPQDTTIHLPSPCFCLPVTSFLQISDAAKSTARTLESIPTETLTQSCTECRENGWLARESTMYCQIRGSTPSPRGCELITYVILCMSENSVVYGRVQGKKGEKKARQQISFLQGLSFL